MNPAARFVHNSSTHLSPRLWRRICCYCCVCWSK